MTRHYRKVIHIKAEDSPNVQAALLRKAKGLDPGNEIVLEGILPYDDYVKRRATWDPVAQCIGLDAQFWEGAELLLYPPDWLNRAEMRALELVITAVPRKARALGCDTGEGTASTCWSVVDELGLLELVSLKTPDTSVIVGRTKALVHKWGIPWQDVMFDRGGGGKQIADALRAEGYPVRTVAFGAPVESQMDRFRQAFDDKLDLHEEKYAYKNARAEMYGTLRELIDPSTGNPPFALPASYTELRRQLAPIPLLYDNEGRLFLPPKGRHEVNVTGKAPAIKTLVELIGCSPDESDSVVIAIHAMTKKSKRPRAGIG
jgi:hypothetical protein